MKRTKLSDRALPDYTRGEEIMNMVTHIVGAVLGLIALILCVAKAIGKGDIYGSIGSAIYGICMTALYCVSSIYHGMKPCTAKKVMQIIDHCTIYFLIAGSYTPICLTALREYDPMIGWGMLILQWVLVAIAVTLTAIDLHAFRVFSMVCYIAMGWGIVMFLPQALAAMTMPGFLLLLFGGIAYTVGAILYGLGKKKRWMHSVFHIFVVLGSLLQFLSILLYAL